MRIATWNVNSMKARLEKIEWWLERAAPDVLLMQETKLSDADAPLMTFQMAGYQLVHHGEGRWNGVAIAARDGIAIDEPITNFGDGPVRNSGAGAPAIARGGGLQPVRRGADAVASASTPPGGDPLRVVSLYAPNGRVVDSPFYEGKLRWFERARRWLDETRDPSESLLLGGDLNVAPTDDDVWDAPRAPTAGRTSRSRSAPAFRSLLDWGLHDAFRDHQPEGHAAGSPGGTTGPATSTRTSGCASTTCCRPSRWRSASSRSRSTGRRARASRSRRTTRRSSSTSTSPGTPFDPGWDDAEARIVARGGIRPR